MILISLLIQPTCIDESSLKKFVYLMINELKDKNNIRELIELTASQQLDCLNR